MAKGQFLSRILLVFFMKNPELPDQGPKQTSQPSRPNYVLVTLLGGYLQTPSLFPTAGGSLGRTESLPPAPTVPVWKTEPDSGRTAGHNFDIDCMEPACPIQSRPRAHLGLLFPLLIFHKRLVLAPTVTKW